MTIGDIAKSQFHVLTPGYSSQSYANAILYNATLKCAVQRRPGPGWDDAACGHNRWSQPSPPPGQTPPPEILQATNGFALDGDSPQYGQQIAPNLPAQVPLAGGSSASWQTSDDPFKRCGIARTPCRPKTTFKTTSTLRRRRSPTSLDSGNRAVCILGVAAFAQRPDGPTSNNLADLGATRCLGATDGYASLSSTDLPQWTSNAQDTINAEPSPCS